LFSFSVQETGGTGTRPHPPPDDILTPFPNVTDSGYDKNVSSPLAGVKADITSLSAFMDAGKAPPPLTPAHDRAPAAGPLRSGPRKIFHY